MRPVTSIHRAVEPTAPNTVLRPLPNTNEAAHHQDYESDWTLSGRSTNTTDVGLTANGSLPSRS